MYGPAEPRHHIACEIARCSKSGKRCARVGSVASLPRALLRQPPARAAAAAGVRARRRGRSAGRAERRPGHARLARRPLPLLVRPSSSTSREAPGAGLVVVGTQPRPRAAVFCALKQIWVHSKPLTAVSPVSTFPRKTLCFRERCRGELAERGSL